MGTDSDIKISILKFFWFLFNFYLLKALNTSSGIKDKSENQLKKDAKKKEKEEKFKEKKEKLAAAFSKANEKPVKIQEKKLISVPSSYTSNTIIGDKKGF